LYLLKKVDFMPSGIREITPTGIQAENGTFQELDVIICATGFNTSFKLPFPIIGLSGRTLNEKYDPHPKTYISIAVDEFPNFFQALGPNAGVGAGSLLIIMEKQVDYAVQCTLKLQRERLKCMHPKREAVDAFDAYIDVGQCVANGFHAADNAPSSELFSKG
jgi:cation diffusion facilitator CzcD-associated flavoprotein CzcO